MKVPSWWTTLDIIAVRVRSLIRWRCIGCSTPAVYIHACYQTRSKDPSGSLLESDVPTDLLETNAAHETDPVEACATATGSFKLHNSKHPCSNLAWAVLVAILCHAQLLKVGLPYGGPEHVAREPSALVCADLGKED